MKELEVLAREYRFDINEARCFLGKEPKKRGASSKSQVESDRDKPRKSSSSAKTKTSGTKRGPSGYNLFVREQGTGIVQAAKDWKSLSDSSREKWNTKARSM